MGTATQTSNARVTRHPPREAPATFVTARARARVRVTERLELARVFAVTVARYLTLVLPQVRGELAQWRRQAQAIPNPRLRDTAERALAKRGNIEGAALFATLVPAAHRATAVRALVAFQTAYNYLDALSELPSDQPVANGEQLHQALLTALGGVGSESPHPDYYALNPDRGDGGYLDAIVDACAQAVQRLPSFAALAPLARCAAARIVDFQALNLNERQGGQHALKQWANELTPSSNGLAWWETAAAAGSSLSVHALIAAAASPDLAPHDAREIDSAYYPWVGALHSLLDSLVDRREDHVHAHRSLLEHYHSPADAAIRFSTLAGRATDATSRLPKSQAHRVIATAMCSYYLSAPECDTAEAQTVTRALTRALGVPLRVAIVMFRVRRLFRSATQRPYT
jgi:tetraprenyl-beta-curcumene synthase